LPEKTKFVVLTSLVFLVEGFFSFQRRSKEKNGGGGATTCSIVSVQFAVSQFPYDALVT
jgi:hypothetical protein